jgi:single-strand DNA-binding protein
MNGAPATIVGNTVSEPELRFTAAGVPWVTFDVAVNDVRTSRNGERTEKTHYVRCKLWRDAAENLVETAGKGTRVIVLGKWVQESWEDQNGNKRRDWVVEVDEVGPSVRWATAKVTKTARSNGNGAPAPVAVAAASNGGDFASDAGFAAGSDEDNPFL